MAKRSEAQRRWRRRLIYPFHAVIVYLLYGLLSLLPAARASALGGWVGRLIGPRLGVSKTALRNLRQALPELSAERHQRILVGMWDNLGRVIAEYPHLDAILNGQGGAGLEQIGMGALRTLAEAHQAAVVVSAHLGNWELMPVAGSRQGLPLTVVHRRPNNPLTENLLVRSRRIDPKWMVPKGAEGARQLLAALLNRGTIGLLIDQKMNDGIAVPFFGRPAMTAPAAAAFALKFRCPIIPARVERLEGATFRLTVFPALEIVSTGDPAADKLAIMTQINELVESWIRERPEQWLWLHRRWPD
ncbi:Kdo2-lipid IVA lauroyltransferase/acyltransferase [uncultured Gammaproteobacteria bacterium]